MERSFGIKLLISEAPHQVIPSLAVKVGLNEVNKENRKLLIFIVKNRVISILFRVCESWRAVVD